MNIIIPDSMGKEKLPTSSNPPDSIPEDNDCEHCSGYGFITSEDEGIQPCDCEKGDYICTNYDIIEVFTYDGLDDFIKDNPYDNLTNIDGEPGIDTNIGYGYILGDTDPEEEDEEMARDSEFYIIGKHSSDDWDDDEEC